MNLKDQLTQASSTSLHQIQKQSHQIQKQSSATFQEYYFFSSLNILKEKIRYEHAFDFKRRYLL